MKQISFLFTLLLLVACNAQKDIDKIKAQQIHSVRPDIFHHTYSERNHGYSKDKPYAAVQ